MTLGTYRHAVDLLSSDETPACAFLRHGLVPSSPFSPAYAVSIRALEIYRTTHLRCPHLAIEPFVKSLCDLYGASYRPSLRRIFSACYDLYLRLRAEVEQKVMAQLKRTGSWERKNACSACTYELKGEDPLLFRILVTMDGNDSLKRILRRALDLALQDNEEEAGCTPQSQRPQGGGSERTDKRVVSSGIYLERTAVDKYKRANPSQPSQPKQPAKGKQKEPMEDAESPCAGRWSNMSTETTGKSWAIFDETGVFLCLCRHGFALAVCDMVQSGEQCVNLALLLQSHILTLVGCGPTLRAACFLGHTPLPVTPVPRRTGHFAPKQVLFIYGVIKSRNR